MTTLSPPRPDLLAPPPRRIRVGEAAAPLPPATAVTPPNGVAPAPAVTSLIGELTALCGSVGAARAGGGAAPLRITLREEPTVDLPAQGYRLSLDPRRLDVLAPDRAGILNGVATARQWLRLQRGDATAPPTALWPLEVEDWPDFAERGVMLDVSRNKVPTVATLERLIDLLSALKINQLQLYTEHTFAYAGHEEVWRDASPLTPADVRDLDRYCAERGVELVPNQNSFGHLHRWLVHHPYRRLAECPEGIEHPWSDGRLEPFSLCPVDPDSLALLEELYEQLLPCFRSGLFNVGLDETFDLGRGRSREACAARGRDRVYLDFLRQVHARVAAWGRRMQFWGDIVLEHPELLPDLPGDVIPLLWGYEAAHPFEQQCRALAATGLEYYVCPGTSSWRSLGGRWTNARRNLASAAAVGAAQGARGYLITDWGDHGHLQVLPVSYPGFLAGACFGWSAAAAATADALPVGELLDLWLLPELGAGAALLELGDAYLATGLELTNGAVPFHLLLAAGEPITKRGLDRLDPDRLAALRLRLETLSAELGALLPSIPGAESELLRDEIRWTADAIRAGCALGEARLRLGAVTSATELPAATRAALAPGLDRLIRERDRLWLARNRSGGLADSLRSLRRVRTLLEG